MKTNLKHDSNTPQYYKDYIYNVDGVSILELKSMGIPAAYQSFVEDGARNLMEGKHEDYLVRAKGKFIKNLILKFSSEHTADDLENALSLCLDEMKSQTNYTEEVQNIYLTIDLFDFIIEKNPHHNESSLKTMLKVMPFYVLAIIGHYNRQTV